MYICSPKNIYKNAHSSTIALCILAKNLKSILMSTNSKMYDKFWYICGICMLYNTEYYLNKNEQTTAIFKSTNIMLSERGVN